MNGRCKDPISECAWASLGGCEGDVCAYEAMNERFKRAENEIHVTDIDNKPGIGWPIGVAQMELNGCIAKESFKRGKLVGYSGRNNDQPIVEFPDGTYLHVASLALTDWKAR